MSAGYVYELPAVAEVEVDASLHPIPLGPVLAGGYTQPEPIVLRRDDSRGLFYRAEVNGLHGDSGIGKSWLMCAAIADEIACGGRVLFVDFEDHEQSVVARLRAVGLTDEAIVDQLAYVRPQVAIGLLAVDHLCRLVAELGITLVIVDSLGEAFALEGINEDKDAEVGPWLRRVARPLAEAGPAVVLIDHATKAGDNPLHPSGSKRKRAAVTGASYLVEAVQPFVKGEGGRLRVTCAKDRHGAYRRGEVVAEAVMAPSVTDAVRITLYAPSIRQDEAALPALLAARAAVAAAKGEAGPVSRNVLEGLMKFRANAQTKRAGIDLAVARGALAEAPGPRGARTYEYVHDMPEEVTR